MICVLQYLLWFYMIVSEKADLVKQVNDLSVLKDDLTLEVSISKMIRTPLECFNILVWRAV